MSCREVRRELANYREHDVSQELKVRIEQHFLSKGRFATYESMRKIIQLMNGAEMIELPEGFSACLYHRIASDSVPPNSR